VVTEHGSAAAGAATVNGTTTETAIALATVVAASGVNDGISATIVTEVAEVLTGADDRYGSATVSQPNC
jgi:hypothetical protein